ARRADHARRRYHGARERVQRGLSAKAGVNCEEDPRTERAGCRVLAAVDVNLYIGRIKGCVVLVDRLRKPSKCSMPWLPTRRFGGTATSWAWRSGCGRGRSTRSWCGFAT